jgi:DNA-binding transcriptional LysR family regulator
VTESSYVVRRLGSEPEIVVVSPAVIDERGPAEAPEDLGGAPWIVHSKLPHRSSCTLRSPEGLKAQVGISAKVVTNNVVAMRDLLLAGAGFGLLPLHAVREDLAAGRLRHACPGWSSRRLVLHALLPTRNPPPRVRVFLDRLVSSAKNLGFDPIK